MPQLPIGFIPEPLSIALDRILPSRKTPQGALYTRKLKQIRSSIDTVGLIEPLTIGKADKATGQHVLLDGHLRLLVLRELNYQDAPCFIATDDETYTYNNRINRLSTVQEHHMIRRAVERGVSKERLALALNMDVSYVLKKLNLLDGLCAEVINILKDQQFSVNLSQVLRKMKPIRQMECVELMVSANNLSVGYAKALLMATPERLLVEPNRAKKMNGITPEQIAKMEREMSNLLGQYKLVEQNYGEDVLNLVLAKGYLSKLLENEHVVRYLHTHHPGVLVEFENIVQTVSLDK
ncbi:plasmid partitioning protein RepB C-terminal domain-containing protein [Candidatus Methylobacter oryzae]|uniref:Chromosome partitioning protein ParB n=1 Tax=Candidatus Methylobacter oryzae TaxID=2497749 RepID=A0ABY3CBL8_9GAMM|nr:plasmid partitioning protein RepB C-terminal domain-containing protein [Candidatus Methylobacter oryzae]TRW95890.1 chromosome partitioning protein ParB [Candidatus Methylobacter oryzae]